MPTKIRKTSSRFSLQQAIKIVAPHLDHLEFISAEVSRAVATIKDYSNDKRGRPEIHDINLLLLINKHYDKNSEMTAYNIVSKFVEEHYKKCPVDNDYISIENSLRVNKKHLIKRLSKKYQTKRAELSNKNQIHELTDNIAGIVRNMRPIE